jgi:hypothetical protein
MMDGSHEREHSWVTGVNYVSGHHQDGSVANAKFPARMEAANIAGRPVNRGLEKEQFRAPLFGGTYLQHNQAIPLNEIASGPADEIGLGPGFEPHNTLDWMLQLLDRFPGKGWKLLRAGLQSPVVRNRNWSLRVFRNWQRGDWPPDARTILRVAANAEPDEKLKVELETCLEMSEGSAR